jgi:hypothetical protein
VEVLAEEGEVDDPELAPRPRAGERALDDFEDAPAPEIPDVREHAEGDVDGRVARELSATMVGDAGAVTRRCPPGTLPPATVGARLLQAEAELCTTREHR